MKEMWKKPEVRAKIEATLAPIHLTSHFRQAASKIHKVSDLPVNILYAKNKGEIIGYEVRININRQSFRCKFSSIKVPMEEKFQTALEWLIEKRKEYNLDVSDLLPLRNPQTPGTP
jgi:GTP-sensing pleiotropic transcriptional regulator CodY